MTVRRPRSKSTLAALLLAGGLVAPAQAANGAADPPAAPAGIAACQACHGPGGISPNPGVPNLAGQKAGYIEGQLAAFKSGDRKHDIMQAIASQLSAGDIKGFAAFWSAQPAAGDPMHTAQATGPSTAPVLTHMTLPAGFPKGFVTYQNTMQADLGPGADTRWTTPAVLAAARAGKPLPDDAVIVKEFHDAKGAITSYAIMGRGKGWGDAVPTLLKNADWNYVLYGADKAAKTVNFNQAQCLACHKAVEKDGYLYTLKDLRAPAKS